MTALPWYRRLFTQTLAFQLGVTAIVLMVAGVAFALSAQSINTDQHGERALAVAESVAAMPIVRENVADPASSALLQPVAEQVRHATNVSFVVIADVNGIRRSHPNSERIGHEVSTDPSLALSGISDVYTQTGTLGPSVRGKVPIYDPSGQIVGLVSVGILTGTVAEAFRSEVPAVLLGSGLAMVLGAIGAWILARRVRSQTHGLEPADIGALSERRQAMLMGIREGVIGLDADGRINLVNNEAARLLHVDERYLGERLTAVLPSTGLDQLISELGEAHRDEELTISDQSVIVNVMPVVVRDNPVGTVLTFRDRTELASVLGELESVRDLVEALRSQAHEFSNTLHTISGLVELDRTAEALELISEGTQTHQRLTSALEEQIGDPLLVGLLIAMSALAAERGIEFTVDSVLLESQRLSSPRELITIVGNLVDNALDSVARPRNTGGAVAIGLRKVGDALDVSVSDNGSGIPDDILESVFEPGFTTKSTETHGGLGLTLVEEAVAVLNGTIAVEQGAGTVFTVVIPNAFATAQVSA
jgi:two-component system CitB family sensor kinase